MRTATGPWPHVFAESSLTRKDQETFPIKGSQSFFLISGSNMRRHGFIAYAADGVRFVAVPFVARCAASEQKQQTSKAKPAQHRDKVISGREKSRNFDRMSPA